MIKLESHREETLQLLPVLMDKNVVFLDVELDKVHQVVVEFVGALPILS